MTSAPLAASSQEIAGRPFLTGEWRYLLMLNYEIEPEVLRPFLPSGTELDEWNGKTYVSIVGFLFQGTKVLGIGVPFHINFEEVNLRFYVRRKVDGEWRRGVTFLREIVPRHAIALVANTLYNERYLATRMKHRIELPTVPDGAGTFEYSWRLGGQWQCVRARTEGALLEVQADSIEEFITEHYWGYACGRGQGCTEYQVAHPRWRCWRTNEAVLECDVERVYGAEYVDAMQGAPASAFVAEGSKIAVHHGKKTSTLDSGLGQGETDNDRSGFGKN